MAFASEDPQQTSLRSDANALLDGARSAVEEAARRKALWIPAQEALEGASDAYARGDYKEAILLARRARRFAELGLEQLDSPPYRHF